MLRSRLLLAGTAASCGFLALLASAPAARAQFIVTNFQTIDPPNANQSAPYGYVSLTGGIANNGTIAGGYTATDSPNDPTFSSDFGYIYQNGTFTTIQGPGQPGTLGNGAGLLSINSAGVTTGLYTTYDSSGNFLNETTFIRSASGSFVTPLPNGAVESPTYRGINDAGQVATQYLLASGGKTHSAIYNLSANTFSYLPDYMTGYNTYIQYVGSNGTTVGTYDNGMGGAIQSFLYRNGTYTSVSYNAPNVVSTKLSGINTAGIAYGRYQDTGGFFHGLLYNTNNGVFTGFDVPNSTDFSINGAGGINDSNRIVGNYADANGNLHGFTAQVQPSAAAPEPSALALLMTGGSLLGSTVLVRCRRRSRKTAA